MTTALTGLLSSTTLLASSSILRISSSVRGLWWVMSSLAFSTVFSAPACQTWSPSTLLAAPSMMWVAVWCLISLYLRLQSITPLTLAPLSAGASLSRTWTTTPSTLWTSTTLYSPAPSM
ncbi:hypothetical protein D1872_285470 [compost metagenome]